MFKFKYYNENSSEFSEGPFTNLEVIDPSFFTGNFYYMDVLDIIFKISHAPFNKLYKTSFLKDLDAQFLYGSYYEDLEFFYKVFLKAKKVSVLPEYLYFYRIRDESISTSGDEGSFDMFNVLETTKQNLIDAGIYAQVKNEWLMFVIVNLKYVYLRLNDNLKDEFIQKMKDKFDDYELGDAVIDENWHYEDKAFYESINEVNTYTEFNLNYEKVSYESLSKHYEVLSNEYKKQIDMLTEENNRLKDKLDNNLKGKFKKIVKL